MENWDNTFNDEIISKLVLAVAVFKGCVALMMYYIYCCLIFDVR